MNTLVSRRHLADDEAQATLELALVISVLLLITVAVCQLVLALNCYLVINSAGRYGARRAAETNDGEAARKASLQSASGLPGGHVEVAVTFPEGRDKARRSP